MGDEFKRVTINWNAGEDPLEDGEVTVENITIGHSTKEQLIEQLRLTREALVEYGQHTAVCRFRSNRHLPPMKCICGFKELMKRLGI